jgi:hypothetical protein
LESKDFFDREKDLFRWRGESAGRFLLRGGPSASLGLSSQFLEDLAASDGEREEFLMAGKGLFEGRSVIDDDVVRSESRFCKIAAVRPAEHLDLITVPKEFYI